MTTELKRIDPKSIPALYEKLGRKPARFRWRDPHGQEPGKCRVCITLALLADKLGPAFDGASYNDDENMYGRIGIIAEAIGMHPSYVCGLLTGWDGHTSRRDGRIDQMHNCGLPVDEGAFDAGIEDGQAALIAIEDHAAQKQNSARS